MAGPVSRGESQVQWASRADTPASARSLVGSPPRPRATVEEPKKRPSKELSGTPSSAAALRKAYLFSPSEQRMAADSPGILTPGEEERLQIAESESSQPVGQRWSSPPNIQLDGVENDDAHRTNTFPKSQREVSINSSTRPPREDDRVRVGISASSMPLDMRPRSRQKEHSPRRSPSPPANPVDEDGVRRRDTLSQEEAAGQLPPGHTSDSKPSDQALRGGEAPGGEVGEEAWGVPFKIQWIRTDKLSFLRTRHLRNPWNHDREVKVSRDGTEIEPSVGAALLAEWDKLDKEAQPPPPPSRRGGGGGSRASFRSGSSALTHSHPSHSHYHQPHGERS